MAEMVAFKTTFDHPGFDVATEAQLKAKLSFPDRRPRHLVFPDDMPQPLRLPREQDIQLLPRSTLLGLGEMDGDAQARLSCTLEDGREERYAAARASGGVAAEVQPDNSALVLQCDVENG